MNSNVVGLDEYKEIEEYKKKLELRAAKKQLKDAQDAEFAAIEKQRKAEEKRKKDQLKENEKRLKQQELYEQREEYIKEKIEHGKENIKQRTGLDLDLKINPDTGSVSIKQTADNDRIIIENDPKLKDCLIFNELTLAPERNRDVPWRPQKPDIQYPVAWEDDDDAGLRAYLQTEYDMHRSEYDDGRRLVCMRHGYHPIKQWLESLPVDIADEHIFETLWPRYLKARCSLSDTYIAEVCRLWFYAAIKRLYEPGCKMDQVPVFVGAQGLGKTSFFEEMVPNMDWVNSDCKPDLHDDQKSGMTLLGKWINLFDELSIYRTEDDNKQIKSYITKRDDHYRLPYDRLYQDHKRQCIFIASTNNINCLKDPTGGRRWLPIDCEGLKLKDRIKKTGTNKTEIFTNDFKHDCTVAWATAYKLYKEHALDSLTLSPENELVAIELQEGHTEIDPWQGMIESYYNEDHLGVDRICARGVYADVIDDVKEPPKYEIKRIASILDNQLPGWHRSDKRQRCGKWGLQICWEPDDQEGRRKALEEKQDQAGVKRLPTASDDFEELQQYVEW